MDQKTSSIFGKKIVKEAIRASFMKLSIRHQIGNPVMFVVYVGAIFTSAIFAYSFFRQMPESHGFILAITLLLWLTLLFANFAEAIAEGRGKAQADTLKKARRDIQAKKLKSLKDRKDFCMVSSARLAKDDYVLVEAGDYIPGDGQVVRGVASVDESAITGESAPVIRESGSDRDAVTGGTRILSDWLIIRITCNPGETFLDRMIDLVEGAARQKTPNEIALSILLAVMTIIFLITTATLLPFSLFSVELSHQGEPITITILFSLLVCLIPTTIGGLLSAIGIAGMDRLIKANVVATSGRAVEAAGDVNILLLDKTGTITFGNRQAVDFITAEGVTAKDLAEAAYISSLSDETPEGKSVVQLALAKYGVEAKNPDMLGEHSFIAFSAETRLSGIDMCGRQIMKGAESAIKAFAEKQGSGIHKSLSDKAAEIARQGATPLFVIDNNKVLGVIHLKDVVKPGIKERLAEIRKMGIKSVMITGDNALTAAAIATEAGVDDFVCEATPETKLNLIRKMQEGGELVAMVGDGTNDAPALAQADVAVAMNSGTQAAIEAGNMVDLDSDPTKLIEIVEIGKQLLMTRGSLTTFSIANDLAKYFAIIPAAFASTYPELGALNVMHLATPHSAILSAVIFNAIIIIFLIPLALKGVKYRPVSAPKLLRHNMLVYGLGGIISPFIGIKIIDIILNMFGLV